MRRKAEDSPFFGTLRGRLVLSVAAVHAVLMSLFILDLTFRQRALFLDRQEEAATALAQSLSTSAAVWIVSDDIAGLQELVESQRRYPEFSFAILTDEEGRVLAHTDAARMGQILLDLPDEQRLTILESSRTLVDAAAPSFLGSRFVGWARVGIGQRTAREKLSAISLGGALYAIAAIAIGSAIAWVLGSRVTRKLYTVRDAINRIRKGDRAARAEIVGEDETASIALDFNALLDELDEQGAALARSEGRYRLLLQNIRAAVIVHGSDTRILMSNPMAQELLGLSEEQMLGKSAIDPYWRFLREDGSEMPRDEYPVAKTLATRSALKDAIVGVRRSEGVAVTWVLVNAEPVPDESGAIGEIIVTFVNITKRKRAEEEIGKLNAELEQRVIERTADLLEKGEELRDNQAALMNIVEDLNEKTAELEQANAKLKELDLLKSMFIASMSHELRTPLNSIIGFSTILLNEWIGPLNGGQKEDLAAVLRSGKHLLSLINDVIDVSKIEAGIIETNVEEFDIADVVAEAGEALRYEIEKKGLGLRVQVPRRALHTDRRRLLQCILNLLSNAEKYTNKGFIAVSTEESADGSILTLTVEDTGIGIGEEDLGRLFSPFVRLEEALGSAIPGTGLGLYLAKKILREILNGDISVTSVFGAGSRFSIHIPLAADRRSS